VWRRFEIIDQQNEIGDLPFRVRYQLVLLSPRWRKLRARRIASSSGKCEKCKKGSKKFELHHLHYDTLGEERDEDVELLCLSCHKEVHEEWEQDASDRAWDSCVDASLDTWRSNFLNRKGYSPSDADEREFIEYISTNRKW
jgi:5-methylcytosine-specific restriction endonuclease McrA